MAGKRMDSQELDKALRELDRYVSALPVAGGVPPITETLRNHIQALEAEIARLRAPGHPTEQETILMELLESDDMQTAFPKKEMARYTKAVRALGAQAQGYKSIRDVLAKNYGTDGDVLERVKDLLESEEHANSEARIEQDERHRVELERDREATRAGKAEQERDAALADLTRLANETASGSLAPDLYQTNGGRGAAEAMAKTLAARTAEMMTAVADNAALIEMLRLAQHDLCVAYAVQDTEARGPIPELLAKPHPGAALLERHRKEVGEAVAEVLRNADVVAHEATCPRRLRQELGVKCHHACPVRDLYEGFSETMPWVDAAAGRPRASGRGVGTPEGEAS